MGLIFKKKIDLVARMRKGDQDSFSQFYNEEFEKIYRFVSFKINNKEEVEEIVQDTFFNFWNHVRVGKTVSSAIGLLYRIARNKIIDSYRKHGVRPYLVSLDDIEGSVESISEVEIEKELDIDFEIRSIEEVMCQLPDDYKDIIIMRFVREMQFKEIAQAIDKSEGTVRVMLHRALKLLKKLAKNNE